MWLSVSSRRSRPEKSIGMLGTTLNEVKSMWQSVSRRRNKPEKSMGMG